MNVLSVCSGVGGLDRGLEAAGHTVVGHCEIDPVCRSILAHHWPDVPIHDDLTTMNGAPWRGRVGLVAGGTPCTDLSVAGRGAGLGGRHSRIFWDFCRVVAESAAPFALWENVPGALSSNEGEDFAAVLWGLTGFRPAVPTDGWTTAGVCCGRERTAVWRVLDARWFGVAQRRRRVFVVVGPRGVCGPEVLLEPESVPRDRAPGPRAGQDVAGTLGAGPPGRGWSGDTDRMTFVPALTAKMAKGTGGPSGDECQNLVPDVLGTLTARGGHENRNAGEQLVTTARPQVCSECLVEDARGLIAGPWHLPACSMWEGRDVVAVSENQRGEVLLTDYAHQLSAGGGKPGQGYPAIISFDTNWSGQYEIRDDTDPSVTVKAQHSGTPAIAYPLAHRGRGLEMGEEEIYNALRAGDGGSSRAEKVLTPEMGVRRLTPVECERLMGWPDDWTRWGAGGVEIANSNRYRACGNGVVSNVTEWIGRRLP